MSFMPRTLEHVLADAQRRGTLGDRPISEVIDHARQFVTALPMDVGRVLDLGTGAGVPGLVVAVERPDIQVVLLDRRENRMDALRRDVAAMGLANRVVVICAEAESAARRPDLAAACGAVVARGFGAPSVTAGAAAPFLRPGGVLVVSEPPESAESRWDPTLLARWGFGAPERVQGVVRLRRELDVSRETPRRAGP
jgi:16S rRNA (guanine527-N7)-methyltransferase